MKNFTRFKIVLPLLLVCVSLMPIKAGTETHEELVATIEARSLQEVLEELGEKYNVLVSYEASVVKDVRIDFELIPDEDLETAFTRLLEDLNFTYEVLHERYVLVYRNDQYNRKTARKIRKKIEQLDKLQEQGSIQLTPRFTSRTERIQSLTNFVQEIAIGIEVTGTVTDDKGEPLIGVNIRVKGTNQGTSTDLDGRFLLENIDEEAVLEVSYIGYQALEVKVGGRTSIDIVLNSDSQLLDEIVVVGYGTMKKSDLTGSISQVNATDLKKYTPANVSDLLRTTVPGLNVGYSVTAKGNSGFEIRGENTLTAGSSPLIVLDGVIYNGDISDINPNDIERIDVLKDASSAAVYGSRASNGVIVISTFKQGDGEKPTITFSSNIGIATASNRVRTYDANGFIQWRSDMFKSVFAATVPSSDWSPFDDPRTVNPQYLDAWLNYHSTNQANMVDAWLAGLRLTATEIESYKAGLTHDWERDIFQNGLRQDYNVSLAGQRQNFNYYWSLGFMNNEALVKGDKFETVRSRINIEGQATSFLKVGVNAQFSFRDESSVPAAVGQYQNLTPYSLFYADDSDILRLYPNDDIQATHPLLERTYRDREQHYFTLFPKIYSILDLPFGIKYTMNFTTRFEFYHQFVHDSSLHPAWGLFGGAASRANRLSREWQIDNIINWSKTFGDLHKVGVTLLANAEKRQLHFNTMANRYFTPNDVLGYHDLSTGTLPELIADDNYETADALMARLNYGFNNRYLLTLSIRRDGSSLFGYSNPHATFPAAAFGWVLSEESFFNSNFIDYMKVRISWGTNGNRAIANYAALSRINTNKYLNADQNGSEYTIPTLSITTMENKNLQWEQTSALNFGVDFNLWNGILGGNIEVYSMRTTDVLVNRELPTITGFNRVYANLGQVDNVGGELGINSRNWSRENFEWQTNFTFSLNRNKIVSITGQEYDIIDENGNVIGSREPDDIANNWFIGHSKDVIWDYKILGTWGIDEKDQAAQWNQGPGDFRLEDKNGDGILNDSDKEFLGYSSPRFRWTMTNNFTFFKNWQASIVMYSYWGQMSRFDQAKHDNHVEDRRNTWAIPYWTPENPTNEYARLRSAPAKGVNYGVYFDQSYVRFENIAIAYRLPTPLLQRSFLQSGWVSFNIRNAALWSPFWDFGDPENGTRTPMVFSLGLNLTM